MTAEISREMVHAHLVPFDTCDLNFQLSEDISALAISDVFVEAVRVVCTIGPLKLHRNVMQR